MQRGSRHTKVGTGWVTVTHVTHPKLLLLPLWAKWRHRFAFAPVPHRQRQCIQPPELTTKMEWNGRNKHVQRKTWAIPSHSRWMMMPRPARSLRPQTLHARFAQFR